MVADVAAARRRVRSQKGETLMESLIAITLLSIIALPVFTGIRVALKASAMHREIAVSETLLRSAAEDLQNPDLDYIPLAGCPGHDTYKGLPVRPQYSPVTARVQFWSPQTTPVTVGPEEMSLMKVASEAPAVAAFTAPGACPAADPGLQKIRLSVVTPSGHLQILDILKRGT